MKLDMEKMKDGFNLNLLVQNIFSFLGKKIKYFVFLLLLALVGYGGFVWYRYVYNSQWTEERIQTYAKTKGEGTVLNRERLEMVLAEKEKRSADYQSQLPEMWDIFRLKQ